MFDFLKKKKKDKEEKKEKKAKEKEEAEVKVRPQLSRNGIVRGMYCTSCGFVQINEDSNELPMEGFAICPNCGDFFKIGWFKKLPDGYALCDEAEVNKEEKKKRVTGGHYRVRRPGPNRSRRKGNINRH